MNSPAMDYESTKAFVVEKAGDPFVLKNITLDKLEPNELLVEIQYAGICHTDLVVQSGHMPFGTFPAVLGHEGAGIVKRIEQGPQTAGVKVGDMVILGFSSCMQCTACNEGRKGACDSIAMINFIGTRGPKDAALKTPEGINLRSPFFGQSSFSKLAVVDARCVVKYEGKAEDLAYLAPLGCGFMTGAATVMNVLKPRPTSRVAIFGMGAVGLSAVMAAKHREVKDILVVDVLPARLDMAVKFGATHVINGSDVEHIDQEVLKLFPQGVDFVIDATGLTKLIDGGFKALSHGGTIAVVGTPKPGQKLNIEAIEVLTRCKTIIGVTGGYCDPQEFIPQLIKMQKEGVFPIDTLCATYPVSKFNEALEDMKAGKVVKAVISW